MLTSETTLVERRRQITFDHGTHPFEAGWASEALFFVRAHGPHPDLKITPQVSPDGIEWLDHDEPVTLPAGKNLIKVSMTQFGTWIRLFIEGASEEAPAVVFAHLALKG